MRRAAGERDSAAGVCQEDQNEATPCAAMEVTGEEDTALEIVLVSSRVGKSYCVPVSLHCQHVVTKSRERVGCNSR